MVHRLPQHLNESRWRARAAQFSDSCKFAEDFSYGDKAVVSADEEKHNPAVVDWRSQKTRQNNQDSSLRRKLVDVAFEPVVDVNIGPPTGHVLALGTTASKRERCLASTMCCQICISFDRSCRLCCNFSPSGPSGHSNGRRQTLSATNICDIRDDWKE